MDKIPRRSYRNLRQIFTLVKVVQYGVDKVELASTRTEYVAALFMIPRFGYEFDLKKSIPS